MNKLMILTTGGTIDKVYFDAASEFQIGAPVIEALLERMNVGFEVSLNQLMRFLTSAVLSVRYKQ
jgi:L-asparaginase